MGNPFESLAQYLHENQVIQRIIDEKEFLIANTRQGLIIREKDAEFKLKPYITDINFNPCIVLLDPDDPIKYQKHLEDISKIKYCAIDIETYGDDLKRRSGLHPYYSKIRLIQIYDGYTVYIVDLGSRSLHTKPLFSHLPDSFVENKIKFKSFFSTLQKLADNGCVFVGHNIHFDTLRLASLCNIFLRKVVCTFIGARMFFGDYGGDRESTKRTGYQPILYGGYGLGNLTKRCLGYNLDKTEQVSDWGCDVLSKEQIEYAAKDTVAAYHLARYLKHLYLDNTTPLFSPGLPKLWKLENEIIPICVEMELNGLPFNKVVADRQLDFLFNLYQSFEKKWAVEVTKDFKYSQTQKFKAYLNEKYNFNLESLNKQEIETVDTVESCPELYLRGQLQGLKSVINNVNAFKKSAELGGNRVKTQFKTLTGFGRFAAGGSKDLINIQSIVNKENPYLEDFELPNPRDIIQVTDDKSYLIIDLAGSHARIAADQAQDKAAIEALNDSSIDNHSKVAIYVLDAFQPEHGLTWKDVKIAAKKGDHPDHQLAKMARDTAKNTFYGFINGAGAYRIQSQIFSNTGVRPPILACEGAIKGCKEMFPNIVRHRYAFHKRLEKMRVNIDGLWIAVNDTSDGGRLCFIMEPNKYNPERLVAPYTNSLASIWSRIEATAIKNAMLYIHNNADPKWKLKLCAVVHDELNYECNDKFAEQAAKFVNNAIGDFFSAQLKFVSDGRETDINKLICKSWSEK